MRGEAVDKIDFAKLRKMRKFKTVYDSIPEVLGHNIYAKLE